jgi:hypothetical protein
VDFFWLKYVRGKQVLIAAQVLQTESLTKRVPCNKDPGLQVSLLTNTLA